MKNLLILACSLVSAGALTLFTSGCNSAVAASSSGLRPGAQCTVQFRRDALGAAASLPISPTTSGINGADTAVSGKLAVMNEEWVVLESRGEIWIPKSVILLI